MNKMKLKELLRSAREEAPPSPSPVLSLRVLRAIEREPQTHPESLLEELGVLFPRVAMAAILLVALCVLTEFAVSKLGAGDLATDVTQLSEQWLFTVKEF